MDYHFENLLKELNIPIFKTRTTSNFFFSYKEKLPSDIIDLILENNKEEPVYIFLKNHDFNVLLVSNKKNTFLLAKNSIVYYDSNFFFSMILNATYSYKFSRNSFSQLYTNYFSISAYNTVYFDISNSYFKKLQLIMHPNNESRLKIFSDEINSKDKNILDEIYFNLDVNGQKTCVVNFKESKSKSLESISITHNEEKKYNLKFTESLEKNLLLNKNILNINTYEDFKIYLSEYLEFEKLINDKKTKIINKKQFNQNLNMFLNILNNKEKLFKIPFEENLNKIIDITNVIFSDTTKYENNFHYKELLKSKSSVKDCSSNLHQEVQNKVFLSQILFLIKNESLNLFKKEFIDSINDLTEKSKKIILEIKTNTKDNNIKINRK